MNEKERKNYSKREMGKEKTCIRKKKGTKEHGQDERKTKW